MKSYDKKINQLIKMYIQAEKRLINIISTKKVKGHVTDFYESMLKQVKLELMQLQMKSANYTKDIVNELYLEAYYNSLEVLGISSIGDGFAQLHTQAIELLSDNMINNFAEVNNQVGRRIEDTIRDIGLTDTQMKFATGQTIRELQNNLIDSLVNTGLGGITDKRGRVIPFTGYAELLSRSIVAETQNTSVKNVMKENGHDLVKMTQHSTACPVCVPYEGRVYSLSGKDERFPSIKKIPGFASGYNNIHPRCRHRIMPWIEKYNDVEKEIKNSNKPFEIPKEKEASVRAYQEHQKEKARLRNDKKQYETFRQVLEEEAPKSFQSFREIKYNDSERWRELKQSYKIVNSYKADFGEVSSKKILELDKLAFDTKRNKQTSKFKKQGNFAVLQYNGYTKFASSRIAYETDIEYIKFKGNKEDLVLLKDKGRVFKTSELGDIVDGEKNQVPRYFDTEAKFFEYLNDASKNEEINEIFMLSEKKMCESCRNVAKQFIKKHPNIKVNVVSSKTFDGWKGR